MCRHCDELTEDRQVVHDFAEQAARRINEKWKQEGIGFLPITPDDLAIRIEVTKKMPMRGYSLLKELTKEP